MNNIFSDYPDIVDVVTLSKMLSIGKNKAYSLITSGAIPSITIGRRHLIPKISVIRYVMGGMSDDTSRDNK